MTEGRALAFLVQTASYNQCPQLEVSLEENSSIPPVVVGIFDLGVDKCSIGRNHVQNPPVSKLGEKLFHSRRWLRIVTCADHLLRVRPVAAENHLKRLEEIEGGRFDVGRNVRHRSLTACH